MKAWSLIAVFIVLMYVVQSQAEEPMPSEGSRRPDRMERTKLVLSEAENRVLGMLIREGTSDWFVHLVLGGERIEIRPCGLEVATAIKNRRVTELTKLELYIRRSTVIEVSYRCDERSKWHVDEIHFRGG
jgi:hypothetical protein